MADDPRVAAQNVLKGQNRIAHGNAIGERKEIQLTEHEISQGFKQPLWLPFEEAFRLISTSNPNSWEGGYIKERDTLIFETARKFI